jgi:hypothetical protein
MGKCSLCGQDAGFLRGVHDACKGRHEAAQVQIASLVTSALDDEHVSKLVASAASVAESAYVSVAERTAALKHGFEAAVESALDDHLLTEDEERRVNLLVTTLGLSESDLGEHGFRDRLVKALVLRDISEGHIPNRFRAEENMPFNLQRGETLIWAFPAVAYYELRTRRSFQGGSQGVSLRVMKGVYYRVGEFKGHPVETSAVELADTGLLGVTTKQLYFAGPVKSFRIPYAKIVSFTPYSDGIGVQKDGVTAKPQTFVTGDGWFTYNLLRNLSSVSLA